MSSLDYISVAISLLTLICTIITVGYGMKKQAQESAVTIALMEERINELTREVRKHNNFAERLPVVQKEVAVLEEKMKVANHRIEDLEGERS